jgi:hypothetical protein
MRVARDNLRNTWTVTITDEELHRMSTSWTYRCLSHNPPAAADRDMDLGCPSQQTLLDDLLRRDQLMTIPDFVWDQWDVDLPRHYRWLRFHRACAVDVYSEYGESALAVPAK